MDRIDSRRGELRALALMSALALAWPGVQTLIWGFGTWGWADWNDFMASGWAASRGLDPYAATHGPNMNPPALLPVFALLWRVRWDLGAGLDKLLGMTCFAGALWATRGLSGRGKWWMALAVAIQAGTSENVFNGQVYGELALLVSLIWLWAPSRPRLAGMLLGVLCAVKPNFGLVAVMLLAPGGWTLVGWSPLGFALANLPAVLLWGFAPYLGWWHLATTTAGYINQVNGTFAPLVTAFGFARWWVPGALGVVALSLWWLHCVRATPRARIAVGVGLGIVLAPVTWVGYSVILLPLVMAGGGAWVTVLGASLCMIPLVPVFPLIYDLLITVTNPLGLVWLTVCALARARSRVEANVAAPTRFASARRQELGAET